MTPELKLMITKSMLEHLKTKGYPDMSDDAIMTELPALWQKLSHERLLGELIRRGLTYQHFINIANRAKINAETIDNLKNLFRNGKSPF